MTPPSLQTDRLVIRPSCVDDAAQISTYNHAQEFWQYTTIPVVPPTPETTRAYLQSCHDEMQENPQMLYHFVLVERATQEVIGDIRLKIEDLEAGKAEFGYGLNPGQHGKGYMTEALREILRFGFEDLNLNRIHAVVYPENVGSIRVLEKCGMTHEGTLRQNAFVRGQYFDERVYAVLREK